TAAVLAGGVDVIYPRENTALYKAIREQGCVVSEMPPGTEPQARHFPRRNRIVSGLAEATVVVEATARSGSLITARLASEQGREVLAVPGSPSDPRSAGPNSLIKDGAALVENADDIIASLSRTVAEPLLPGLGEDSQNPVPSLFSEGLNPSETTVSRRHRLLESLTTAPLPVDVALRECQLSAAEGAVALLELELAGRIERLPGQMIALIPES
ncbi:MAG: DNA-protecting protein DprA, partial [Rhodospirillaceae bacterium]|nr:DNA-protecting protein DprA [Rhodospirillaceae bacterium]